MITTDIDSIVRSSLLTHGLSLHYYVQFLHFALKAVKQELEFDALPNIKTTRLTVSDYNTVNLPSDYIDWIKVGQETGVHVKLLGVNAGYNRLHRYNTTGEQIAYDSVDSNTDLYLPAVFQGAWFANYITDMGEHRGRFYGLGEGTRTDVFKEIRERGELQFDPSMLSGKIIYLEYIYLDEAATTSLIHPYAAGTIEKYITWQFKNTSRLFSRFEVKEAKDEYYAEYRRLRARLAGWTHLDILRALRKFHRSSIRY